MPNQTLLVEAIQSGHVETVKELLQEEASLANILVDVEMFETECIDPSISIVDNPRTTKLPIERQRVYTQPMSLLMLALLSEHPHAVDTIPLLLNAGADVNTQVEVVVPDFGATALAVAIKCSQLEAAKLLIEKGADVNAVNPKTGNTPLHDLAQIPHEYFMSSLALIEFDLVPAMIERCAACDKKNLAGQTPIEIATQQGKFLLADLLISTPPQPEPGLAVTKIPPVYATPVSASFFPSCGHTQQPLVVHPPLPQLI